MKQMIISLAHSFAFCRATMPALIVLLSSLILTSNVSGIDKLLDDGDTSYRVELGPTITNNVKAYFDPKLLSESDIEARLYWRFNDIWSIHLLATQPGFKQVDSDGKWIAGYSTNVIYGPTINVGQQQVFRSIGTIEIRTPAKAYAIDFEITLKPKKVLREAKEAIPIDGSIIWGAIHAL